jgi:mannosyltransferase OCH1-like enzyme
MLIPQVLHYIWLGQKPMHPLMTQWRLKWAALHPTWKVKVWHEVTAMPAQLAHEDEILECRHADYLRKCPTLAKRSDVWRYDLLEQQGGIYLDTDFEPLRNIEILVADKEAFAGKCCTRYGWSSTDPVGKFKIEIGCSIMGTTPHHPWILDLFDHTEQQDPVEQLSLSFPYITQVTARHPGVHLFEPEIFYPIRWDQYANLRQDKGAGSLHKKAPPPEAYAVHQWSSNWFPNGLKPLGSNEKKQIP